MITSFIPNLLFLFVQISSETIETHRLGKLMTYIITYTYHSFIQDPNILHPNDIAAWPLHASLSLPGDRFSRPTPELIIRAGYPVETHQVVTGDGYILSLHRIPVYRTVMSRI